MEEKCVHVARVRKGDGAGGSVVLQVEPEDLRGDRVGLHLVQGRQGGDKVVEVDFGMIFYSKVVNDKHETDRESQVAKKTGSGSFNKAEGRQERDKATVTKLTGFFEAVHCLVDPEEAVPFPGRVDLDIREERETRQDFRGIGVDVDFDELRR